MHDEVLNNKQVLPRAIVWPLKVLLGLVVLLAVIIGVGLLWLHSKGGQAYLQDMIEEQVSQAAGYRLSVEDIGLHWPAGVRVGTLSLSDQQGEWLRATQIRASLKLDKTMLEQLVIPELQAASLQLVRAPGATIDDSPDPATDTAEPEDGISVMLEHITVNDAHIGKALTGLPQDMTGGVNGELAWLGSKQRLTFQADATITQGLPELTRSKAKVEGEYRVKDELLALPTLTLNAKEIQAAGHGDVDIGAGRQQFTFQVEPVAMQPWVEGLSGSAAGEIVITGSFDQPAMEADIRTRSLAYDEMTFPDAQHHITATLTDDGLQGTLSTSGEHTLQASADYALEGEQLRVSDLSLRHGDNRIDGELTLNTDKLLADGTITATLPDLTSLPVSPPFPLSGAADIKLTLTSQQRRQAAQANATLTGFHAAGFQADHIAASAETGHVKAQQADSLALEIKRGQYQTTRLNQLRFHADKNGQDWKGTLEAEGKAGNPFTINTSGRARIDSPETWRLTLASFIGQYAGYPVSAKQPVTLTTSPEEMHLNGPSLSLAEGDIRIDARRIGDRLEGRMTGSKLALSAYNPPLPEALQEALVAFTITLDGTLASPRANADVAISNMTLPATPSPSTLSGNITLREDKLSIDADIKEATRFTSQLQASVPVTFTLQPASFTLANDAPLSGQVTINLPDIATPARLLLPANHQLAGNASMDLTLDGTINQPKATGTVVLRDGSYQFLPAGTALEQIEATLTAKNTTFSLTEFTARDSDGNTITGTGEVELAALDALTYQAELEADAVKLLNHPNAQGRFSGTVKVAGSQQHAEITGDLTSDSLSIYLPQRFGSAIPELNVIGYIPPGELEASTAESAYPVALNIAWKADNQVFVRGWGLDAELRGNLDITGQAASPDIDGKLTTIRGRYEEFGKRFTLKEGELVFQGAIPPSPYLNIVASNTVDGTEIRPVISGSASDPTLSIQSTPAMPEEDALSLLLFGEDPGDISPVQAAQLASSLSKLSGFSGGGFDPVSETREFLGLDDLKINTGSEGIAGATVGVGKYISDEVYLEVERGLQGSTGRARLEVDVSPSISVESSTGADGDNSVGVNWKYDY